MAHDLLVALGRRTRAARAERGWTIREVAERSGVSPRFLMHLEAGRGNISVRRLADVARALQTTPAALLAESVAPPPTIALLGLRGAGKTTVGRRLARRLRIPFVELDGRIEAAAGLSLREIFSLHGEEYYRRLEGDVLDTVVRDREPIVLATGGGIVTSPDTYDLLRRSAVTVWLRARPEDHWDRVLRQGDCRPLDNNPQAMADLRALLARRERLYTMADHIVETSGVPVAAVVADVYARVWSEQVPAQAPMGAGVESRAR